MRQYKSLLLVVPALLVVAACSSTPVITQSTLEEQAIAELTASVGQAPDSLTCPGDLNAEVGATSRCELTAGDSTYGVTITVTAVNGDVAEFDVVVDDTPVSG